MAFWNRTWRYQQILLLDTDRQGQHPARLPVGVLIRNPRTGRWRKSMLDIAECQAWQERLAHLGDHLDKALLVQWRTAGGRQDVLISVVWARDMAHAYDIAEATLLEKYVLLVEEEIDPGHQA